MPDLLAPPAARPVPAPSAGLKEVVSDPEVRYPDFTAADVPALLESLGGVPAERVRLSPTPGTATAEDAEWFHDHDGRLYELIDGTLVEKAMSDWSGFVGLEIASLLRNFVRARGLGGCHGADGFFRFSGDLRGPDASFTPKERRRGPLLRRGYSDVPPALVVEVWSPSNRRAEMNRKRATYFAHGVTTVWEADEDADGPLVRVYDGPDSFVTLRAGETLTGDPVLPGFEVAVNELFIDPFAEECDDENGDDAAAAGGGAG